MNYFHQVYLLPANTVKNITISMSKDEEYAVYWTLASLESCADAYHTPIGY